MKIKVYHKFVILGVVFLVVNIGCLHKQKLVDALEPAAILPQKSTQELPKNSRAKRQDVVAHSSTFSTTLSSWINQFSKLPKNRKGADARSHSGFALSGDKNAQWQEFLGVLNAWLRMQASGRLTDANNWSSSNTKENLSKPKDEFFDISKFPIFTPFAQKFISNPGDIFYFHGDLHGDIFSLLEELKDLKSKKVIDDYFRITQDNVWFVFLGDYVDRGQYGAEVLYTMMRLALANPDRVIAVRGNHEDIVISSLYGFKEEIKYKFGDADGSKHKQISRMNDFLPVVFYLGCKDENGVVNYLQCCHGGVEEEYEPKSFLDDPKTIYQLLGIFSAKHSCNSPFDGDKAIPFGFMWNDFDVDDASTDYRLMPGRGLRYGKAGTERVLIGKQSSAKSQIRGIFRAHQHSGEMNSMMKGIIESNGIYKLWKPHEKTLIRHLDDGLVWTFNVGPDTVYGESCKFNFDTYVELTTAQQYKDWIMKVFNTNVL